MQTAATMAPATSFAESPASDSEAAPPLRDAQDIQDIRQAQHARRLERKIGGIRWGAVFLSALGGLFALAIGLWLEDAIGALLAREGWLGWLALGLLGVLGLSALAVALRELHGLMRLARLGAIRARAEAVLGDGAEGRAGPQSGGRESSADRERLVRRTLDALARLYRGRTDMAWALAKIGRHRKEILTARELLALADREISEALDPRARAIVAAAARRVSVLTALSPAPLLDMALVGWTTLGMIRRLALLHGGRPGVFALLALLRRVIGHIVLTGGIAFAIDLAQDILGRRLVGLVAGRLGEGFFNGALTARLGLAAIEVCRPLPRIESKPPGLRRILREIASPPPRKPAADQPPRPSTDEPASNAHKASRQA